MVVGMDKTRSPVLDINPYPSCQLTNRIILNLVRFAHNWNDGTMELWNDGLEILQCWVNGNNRLDDKIKNG